MTDADNKNVMVTDEEWKFLESTREGKARKLLKTGKADLIAKDPPFIQLKKKVFIQDKKEKKMNNLRSIDQYFKDQEEVYVQNVIGGIVSLTFHAQDGRVEPFTLPNDKRPVRLTDYIPKDMIRRSPDFRKLLMRRPPAIRLLTDEQYGTRLEKLAKTTKKSEDEIVNEVAEKLSLAQRKIPEPAKKKDTDPVMNTQNEPETPAQGVQSDVAIPGQADDGINPRILQIVGNCSTLAEERLKAEDAIAELENVNLTLEDANYIVSSCQYKTVQTWAQKQIKKMEAGEEE